MAAHRTYDLTAYRRHAERFGTECVFETAVGDLEALDLGRLSLWMQGRDPKWQPPVDRAEFARELIDAGEPTERACRMAMVSRSTLVRREKVARQEPKVPGWGPNPPYSWGENVSNRGTPIQPLPTPDLTLSRPENGSQRVVVIAGQMSIFDVEKAPV